MRKAVVYLSHQQVERMLNLPDGVMVSALQSEIDPPRLKVLLVGNPLPEVPEDCESPVVNILGEVTQNVRYSLMFPDRDSGL